MASRIKQTSEVAEAFESHLSLVTRVIDNWPWVVAMIGIPGVSGYLAWLKQTALNSPWYDKAFFAIFAVLSSAFLILGIRAFLAWARRSRREEGAVATGLAWSGYTYGPGSIIDGGTHRLSEIFGIDQIRNNLVFRNCRIEGPGLAIFVACHCDKSDFFNLPRFQFIDPTTAGEAAQVSYQFLKCRFENCAFSKMMLIANIEIQGSDIVTYKLVPSGEAGKS